MAVRFTTSVCDMGGWIRVLPGSGEPTGEVARFLSQPLIQWFRECPELTVRRIVPITSNGDTSELHAWYDRIGLPARMPNRDPSNSGIPQ